MARNTRKNQEMQQHPEMAKAMEKAVGHPRPVKRKLAGLGSGSSGYERPFPMTDSPAGGGEIIARAIHYNEAGVNDLPDDAVIVCVFRRYARVPMTGPGRHYTFRLSELTPFDEKNFTRMEIKDERPAENQEKVSGTGESSN